MSVEEFDISPSPRVLAVLGDGDGPGKAWASDWRYCDRPVPNRRSDGVDFTDLPGASRWPKIDEEAR